MKRIFAKITIDDNQCWVYNGWDDGKGYKKIKIMGVAQYVHRFVYNQFNEPITNKNEIGHICLNRSCCNPAHLRKETRLSNMREMHTRRKKNAAKTLPKIIG